MLRKTTSLRGLFAAALVAGAAVVASTPASATDAETLAMGGRFYDDWTKITNGFPPIKPHPGIASDSKLLKKPILTWRCKTCHGWDYRGVDGAYGLSKKSPYFTGYKGVNGAAGKSADEIVAILKDGNHGYAAAGMPEDELKTVATFISEGQIDMTKYINDDKSLKAGDAAKGKPLFEALCASCHGFDGRKISGMDAVAYEVKKNPWQALHKIRNGQPKEAMVSLNALPEETAVDVLAYTYTLPAEGMHDGDPAVMDAFIKAGKKIDADPKSGDAAKGKDLYETLCSGCHGLDGKKNMQARMQDGKGTLGAEAAKNPAEALNKIFNGQPKKGMISMRVFPVEDSVNVLAHVLTLPKE